MGATVGATILFTDLVGSTALASQVGASAAEDLRQAHFGVLRDAAQTHGGREVKNLGDGLMVAFPGSSAALDAAAAMQGGIARHNRRAGGPPLAVRIGIATGDCTEDGEDFFGEPVIQAARLCAVADGDEVLATQLVGLLAPRDAHQLVDVGPIELKGLPEPVHAVRLLWATDEAPDVDGVPLPPRLGAEHLAPLVGRQEHLETLRDALKAAHAGERRVALITGEAGLGKTRLTAAFATEAFESGALVLYGRCDEELAVPYLPWIEALRHFLDHVADEGLPTLDPTVVAPLGRLLPGLAERLGSSGSLALGTPGGDQYALVASVTRLVEAIAARHATVVVLDDLHWADDASLLLLRQVVTTLPDSRLLVIGTYRETDLGPDDTLTDTSARLHRVGGVHRLALTGLSDREVVALVEGTAGHDLDERAVALAQTLRGDTAGNPFFLTEVLRHLAESGQIVQGDDGRWTITRDVDDLALPQSVRDVVGQRVRRLGPRAHAVLTTAAVCGREFDCPVVASATDLDEDTALDALEEAMNAGLIAEDPASPDRFSFTHALVQHTLYEELSGSRRARLHHRVASAIEELVGDRPGDRVGELAKHWFAAVRPSELDRAISYAMRAGAHALAASAPDEAVRWFTQALESTDAGQGELACEIRTRLGDAERRAGRGTYRERLLEAARTARELGRDDLLVAAAIANYRGLHSASGVIDEEKVAVLEAALDTEVGRDPATRARLLATLVGELTYDPEPDRFEHAREAVALARQVGDDDVLIDVLDRFSSALSVPDLLDERVQRTEEAMALTADRSDSVGRFLAVERRSTVLLELADMPRARVGSREMAAIAHRLGEPTLCWLATQFAAVLDFVEGDLDQAVAGAQAALQIAQESGQTDALVYWSGLMLQVQWHRGLFAETIPLVEQAAAANPGLTVYRTVLAVFCAHLGRHDEARAWLADLAADDYRFPYDVMWLTSSAVTAEAVSLVGDVQASRVLYDRLVPYVDHVAASRTSCQGCVGYHLGLLATTLGRHDKAVAHHEVGLERNTGLRSPFLRARSMVALADLLGDTDPERAVALTAEAAELVERHGFGAIAGGGRARA